MPTGDAYLVSHQGDRLVNVEEIILKASVADTLDVHVLPLSVRKVHEAQIRLLLPSKARHVYHALSMPADRMGKASVLSLNRQDTTRVHVSLSLLKPLNARLISLAR